MSTPTRISQELRDKSDRSARRMKSFKRSLLMLGGLTKLQRRSITSLIQDFWLENAKNNLDTSTTQMKHEAIGTHNGEFTDSSPLTSTDTSSDSNTEQRSQSTSFTSCSLMQTAPEYFDIHGRSGETTPRRELQQAAIEYFDIQSESSETDHSKYDRAGAERFPFSLESNSVTKTHNRFEYLEGLDAESDTDDDMSMSIENAVKEEKISQLEQKIKALETTNHSRIEKLKEELTRSKSSEEFYQSKYRESGLQIKRLEDQVKALLKEQSQSLNTDIIDHVIRREYDRILQQLVFKAIKDEQALKNKSSIFSRLIDNSLSNRSEEVTREIYDKTRISLLKSKDLIQRLSDEIKSSELVPVTEIEKMEKKGGNFELHMEMVLAKLTRAYAKKLELS